MVPRFDFIDEEVTQGNEDEAPRRKKRKKVVRLVFQVKMKLTYKQR